MLKTLSICSMTAALAWIILLSSCQSLPANGGENSDLLPMIPEPALVIADNTRAQDRDAINKIANDKGIIGTHGTNFIYIDEQVGDGYLIVHETFASRSKYKSLTPIIDVKQDNLFIDCSYIRSIEDEDSVSVGSYCRGRSEASLELIDDAISGQHLLTYSASFPWLADVATSLDCAQARGLEYNGYHITRCQNGQNDETTENTSIHVLSTNNSVIFSMNGFELSPAASSNSRDTLVFWKLDNESHHMIVEKALP